ncbi:MAG: hypothetical protein ACD_50C00150G0002 [uncultured bacterium]|nr:MAG: hypothetical protein ACD_50C00150G0002 [uncultured bacterium]
MPKEGPTVVCPISLRGAGSAPAFNWIARFFACSCLKLPVITASPLRIGCCTTGAEITTLSRTIATGFPTFLWVISANNFDP